MMSSTKPLNMSAKAPMANTSKDVRGMFGLSLHGWENSMVFALIIAGVFALVAGIATWQVVRLQRIEIAESNARQKEAELKLEQLRKLAGPRGIRDEEFLKPLEGAPKSLVQIWYSPVASDGFWLANQLVSAIIAADWRLVEPPTPIPEVRPDPNDKLARFMNPLMALGAQPSGVTVIAHGTPADIDKDNPSLRALMTALARGMETSIGGAYNVSVPEGVLRVVIAAKSDPILPTTPATAGDALPR
jgi:hypothetical protein